MATRGVYETFEKIVLMLIDWKINYNDQLTAEIRGELELTVNSLQYIADDIDELTDPTPLPAEEKE